MHRLKGQMVDLKLKAFDNEQFHSQISAAFSFVN